MSDPIVIELQRLASESGSSVEVLLRKALIVATKLSVDDFLAWIRRELHGYQKPNEVPDYRYATGEISVYNDVQRRWIPFVLPPDIEKLLTRLPIMQPVGSLERLLADSNAQFQLRLTPEMRNVLLIGQGNFPMEPRIAASRVYIARAVDAVRNAILEWSLKLEQEGILGEGMAFSKEEKERAAANPNIQIGNIEYFQGSVGNITDSTVTQDLEMNVASGDFSALEKKLREVGVGSEDIDSLREAIESDPKPNSSDKFGTQVSIWIGRMVSQAANGAWNIGVETAAKILPPLIAAYYGLPPQ